MLYLFVDEAGNFDFSPQGSNFFIVAAVAMRNWEPGVELLELRHRLAMEGAEILEPGFHAAHEKQAIRDQVFGIIQRADLEIHAVVLEKRKTLPRIAADEGYFYQLSWHFLFKHVARKVIALDREILIVGSSLGTAARKRRFKVAIESVVNQHSSPGQIKTAFWPASSHPCLQIADYCAWAIQRWKERSDHRSWMLIEPKVKSCFEPFLSSRKVFY